MLRPRTARPGMVMMLRKFIYTLIGLISALLGKPVERETVKCGPQTEGLFFIDGNPNNRVYIHKEWCYSRAEKTLVPSVWMEAVDSGWIGYGFLDEETLRYTGVFRHTACVQDKRFIGAMGMHEISFTPDVAYVSGYNTYAPPGSNVLLNVRFYYELRHTDESDSV